MEKTDTEKAQEFKAQGNEFFKNKEYLKAIEQYTKAIGIISIRQQNLNHSRIKSYGPFLLCQQSCLLSWP